MSSTTCTATLLCELEVTVEGLYESPVAATRDDPSEGDTVEDVAIAELTFGKVSLLDGVDTTSPAVRRLLDNILAIVHAEAEELLREDAIDG